MDAFGDRMCPALFATVGDVALLDHAVKDAEDAKDTEDAGDARGKEVCRFEQA